MVEPATKVFERVTPSVRVPVVVTPGNLSPATEVAAVATEETAEDTACTATAGEAAVIMPLTEFGFAKACTVKVPLAVFEAILQLFAAMIIM